MAEPSTSLEKDQRPLKERLSELADRWLGSYLTYVVAAGALVAAGLAAWQLLFATEPAGPLMTWTIGGPALVAFVALLGFLVDLFNALMGNRTAPAYFGEVDQSFRSKSISGFG